MAYVAAEHGGLVAVDISEPAAPQIAARYDPGRVSAVAVEGGRAYVSANARLTVLDITTPATIAPLGSFTATRTEDLIVSGGIVWAFDGNNVVGIDARDPRAPRHLTSFYTGRPALAAAPGRLYVATSRAVTVYGVDDPEHPVQLGRMPTDLTLITDAALDGASLYVTGQDWQSEGYTTRTVGNLARFRVDGQPLPGRRTTTPLPAMAVAVAKGVTYVATTPGRGEVSRRAHDTPGLRIYRRSALVGTIATLGLVTGVDVSAGWAFIAAGASGLAVLDVSNPRAPTTTGPSRVSGFAERVAVDGQALLVAERADGVEVFDMADPRHPQAVGRLAVTGTARDVAAQGALAVVVTTEELATFDITDPAAPRALGAIDGGALELQLVGDTALVAGGTLRVIDLSNPARPAVTGEWSPVASVPYASALGVAGASDKAYVASLVPGFALVTPPTPRPTVTPGAPTVTAAPTRQPDSPHGANLVSPGRRPGASPRTTPPPDAGRLHVVSVAPGAAPAELGVVDLPGPLAAVAVDAGHGRVFASGTAPGGSLAVIQAFDVSNPAGPRRIGSHNVVAEDLVFEGGLLYVAAFTDGFWILRPVAPGDVRVLLYLPRAIVARD